MLRKVAQIASAAIVVVAVAACSPVMTNRPYAASDGVRVIWDEQAEVRGENLMILTSAEGEQGRVLGAFVNGTDETTQVRLALPDGMDTVVEVPGSGTLLLNGTEVAEGDESDVVAAAESSAVYTDLLLDSVPAAPGSTLEVTFETPSQGSIVVNVPVLDGTLPEYTDYVP